MTVNNGDLEIHNGQKFSEGGRYGRPYSRSDYLVIVGLPNLVRVAKILLITLGEHHKCSPFFMYNTRLSRNTKVAHFYLKI